MESLLINNVILAASTSKSKEVQIKIASSNQASVSDKSEATSVDMNAAEETVTTEGEIVVEEATDTTVVSEEISVTSEETVAADEAAASEGVSDVAVTDEVAAADLNTEVISKEEAMKEGAVSDGVYTDPAFDEGMYTDPTMQTGMVTVKDPLLSSWPFVIGISAAVLFVSIVLGALLARRKIKKGIELYED